MAKDTHVRRNLLNIIQGTTATTTTTAMSKERASGALGGAGMFENEGSQKPRLDRLNFVAFATA